MCVNLYVITITESFTYCLSCMIFIFFCIFHVGYDVYNNVNLIDFLVVCLVNWGQFSHHCTNITSPAAGPVNICLKWYVLGTAKAFT